MFYRQSRIEDAYMNTCHWILDTPEYRRWAVEGGLFWVKGIPGAGKSTLMSYLHRRARSGRNRFAGARSSEITLEFFFHRRGSHLQRSPLGMLRSLLNQLLRQCPEACDSLQELYTDRLRAFGSQATVWEWQSQELEPIFVKCVVEAMQRSPILIFIDAVDEAGGESFRLVVKYFHSLNDRTTSLKPLYRPKICISSRHYPVLSITQGPEVWVERHNRNDIALFVQDTLRLTDSEVLDPSELRSWNTLQADIIRRSNGIFQWVRLVMPMLEQQLSDGLPIQHAREWLQQVPQNLEKVYALIVQQLIESGDRSQSLLLFQWVCFAKRPLDVTEMRYAMAADEILMGPPRVMCYETENFVATDLRMKLRIRALSGGLVEIAETHDSLDVIPEREKSHSYDQHIVQLIHESAKEFLLTKGLKMLAISQEHSVSAGDSLNTNSCPIDVVAQGHTILYRSCLDYLAIEGLADGVELIHEGTSFRAKYESIRYQGQTVPLTSYAAHYVFWHARRAATQSSEELSRQIELFDMVLDAWLQLRKSADSWEDAFLIEGGKPIHVFAYFGLENLVNHLIHTPLGLDTTMRETRTMHGYTPLYTALWNGELSTAKALIDAGAEIEVGIAEFSALTKVIFSKKAGIQTGVIPLLLCHMAERCGKAPRELKLAISYLMDMDVEIRVLFCQVAAAASVHSNILEEVLLKAARAVKDEHLEAMIITAGGDPSIFDSEQRNEPPSPGLLSSRYYVKNGEADVGE